MKIENIKFRGKSKRTGEWLYGDLEYNRKKDVARIHSYDDEGEYIEQQEVYKETIGQFIRMTDKNENEIYEGDIIKTDDGLDISGYYEVSYDIGTTGFICVGKDVHCPIGVIEELSDIVVVGNIYDNKELLMKRYE